MGNPKPYWGSFLIILVVVCLLSASPYASSFILPTLPSSPATRIIGNTCCLRTRTSFIPISFSTQNERQRQEQPCRAWHNHRGLSVLSKYRRTRVRRGDIVMERRSGEFQRLAKPKFDPDNPNAILGEIEVPGLKQLCLSAQTQLFPKREAVQLVKDKVQAWCEEENRREQEGVTLRRRTPSEDRALRTWRAHEFTAMPSNNRTLDSEVLGMNVGRAVNETRLQVAVDFGNETEAMEVGVRLLNMVADVSKEVNEVFGYADDASSGGEQLGPWKKAGTVNSWRKWVALDSGEPLPESAVTVFRIIQANWAVPQKISDAMNFTASWTTARFEDSMKTQAKPLRRVEVLHSALHPHVIKVMETFASEDALLEYFHQCNSGYLEGVSDFRAAVSPTTQAYTPLEASLRPALSARLVGGAMVPLVAIGGPEHGVAPSTEVMLEGFKIGLRHVVLEAGSSGVDETVEALNAALTFDLVKRADLFVTLIVGEERARLGGGEGIAAAVRETLAPGKEGQSEGGGGRRLLDYVDALVLEKETGRHFDDDEAFLAVWDEVREVAVSPPAQRVPTTTETKPESGDAISSMHSENPTLPPLARHLGIGGHGPLVAERLAFLFKSQQGQKNVEIEIEKSDMPAAVAGTIPDIIPGGIAIPSLFFGDLGAGDGAATAETIDMCRNRGVQAFSIRYAGGEGAEEAGKGAAAAADWEHEDITGDEVLAKWVLELGGGLIWRPRETADVARTLPLARYFLPPEWITEIVEKGGCPPEAWARTLSRLLPPEGNPSDEELGAEVNETLRLLMDSDDDDLADWDEDDLENWD